MKFRVKASLNAGFEQLSDDETVSYKEYFKSQDEVKSIAANGAVLYDLENEWIIQPQAPSEPDTGYLGYDPSKVFDSYSKASDIAVAMNKAHIAQCPSKYDTVWIFGVEPVQEEMV